MADAPRLTRSIPTGTEAHEPPKSLEIAHVDDRHAAERLQTERALGSVPVAGALASIPVAFVQAGYSKAQELEADRDGVSLAVDAGYSPTGAVRMLEALAKREPGARPERAASPSDEAGEVAGALVTGYFRTHPFASERSAAIRALVRRRQWPAGAERPLPAQCVLR